MLCKGCSWGCGRGEVEAELAGGVFEPGGDVGGEAAADDDVEGGREVDGDKEGLGAGEHGLGTGAGWEHGGMEIEGAAAGEDIERGGPGQANDRLAGTYVNYGGDVASQSGLQITGQGLGIILRGEQEPFVGSQPDCQESLAGGCGVGRERELDAEHLLDCSEGFRVGGVQSQIDVSEEGAFEELAFVRRWLRGFDCAER